MAKKKRIHNHNCQSSLSISSECEGQNRVFPAPNLLLPHNEWHDRHEQTAPCQRSHTPKNHSSLERSICRSNRAHPQRRFHREAANTSPRASAGASVFSFGVARAEASADPVAAEAALVGVDLLRLATVVVVESAFGWRERESEKESEGEVPQERWGGALAAAPLQSDACEDGWDTVLCRPSKGKSWEMSPETVWYPERLSMVRWRKRPYMTMTQTEGQVLKTSRSVYQQRSSRRVGKGGILGLLISCLMQWVYIVTPRANPYQAISGHAVPGRQSIRSIRIGRVEWTSPCVPCEVCSVCPIL